MKRTFAIVSLVTVLLLAIAPAAHSQTLPAVNLGFTSFLDGGPPAGPGFYFQEYLQFYTADEFRDQDGNTELNQDVDVFVSLNQFIYQSDQDILLGGKWGIDFILPLVNTNLGAGPLVDNDFGIGDILIGPFVQWDPIMGENGPKFMHRIELQFIAPTGKYDNTSNLNPGSNHFSFNPYWSGTYFFTPKLTGSVRLHYLWNAQNDDPFVGLNANDVQAGQAIHLNFAAAYELMPKKLHAGINGYYLKQITESQINGTDLPNSKEQVLGIGPGAVYHFSQDDHIFVNLFWETAAENRPEGFRATLRWTHHF